MEKFVWSSERYSIDGGVVDHQHRHLMEMVNGLLDLSEQAVPSEVEYIEILIQLDEYVHNHFKVEEGLMRARAYPDLDQHTGSHVRLSDKASALLTSPDVGKVKDVALFLQGWLQQHILVEDMRFKKYLESAGN